MQITEGVRVASTIRVNRRGTLTGEVRDDLCFPEGQPRAHVVWDDGSDNWPLVRVITEA